MTPVNTVKDVLNGSKQAASHSFIFGLFKVILACYFIVFFFEIYKKFEDRIMK